MGGEDYWVALGGWGEGEALGEMGGRAVNEKTGRAVNVVKG